MRTLVRDFDLSNPIYRNAVVTFYTVSGGVRTNTLAPLYPTKTGTARIGNPQRLTAAGMLTQSVYIDTEVIATIVGLNTPSHDTGVISLVATGVDVSPFMQTVLDDTTSAQARATLGVAGFVELILATGAGLIGWMQNGVNALLRTISDKLHDRVCVADFPTIQDALNTGKNVYGDSSRSTFQITAPVVMTTNWQILDLDHATINLNDPTGLLSHLKVGDDVTQLQAVRIKRVIFTRTQTATDGAAIDAKFVGLIHIEDCRIYGNNLIYDGIRVTRGIIYDIHKNFIDGCVNSGVVLAGTSFGANSNNGLRMSLNWIEHCGRSAVSASDFVEGTYIHNNVFFSNSVTAVEFNASVNANGGASHKVIENDFDSSGLGFFLDKMDDLQINNCWFSNNASVNLQVGADVVGVTLSGNQFYGSTAKGIQTEADQVVITGNLMSGGDDGIFVRSTANIVHIGGNVIVGMTGYAINLTESPTKVIIGPNTFASNSTDVSTGPTSPTIASASTIRLPGDEMTITISGGVTIDDIEGGYNGRHVTLIFSGGAHVTHNAGGVTKIYIKGAADFVPAAGGIVLGLAHDGVRWYGTPG